MRLAFITGTLAIRDFLNVDSEVFYEILKFVRNPNLRVDAK